MTIAKREQQILRIKTASFQTELDEQLRHHLQRGVVAVVQTTIEAALVEEVNSQIETMTVKPSEIGAFPNETSCLTPFSLVMLRDHAKHDRWVVANNS